MYPRHPRAQALYHRHEQTSISRNTGYWNSQASRILREAAAVCAAAVDATDDLALRADLAGVAADALAYIDGVLDVCVLSREDVEMKFQEMRKENPHWPKSISKSTWRTLERCYYLRDISNVLLDGGDFWIAVECALNDVFEAPSGPDEVSL